MGSGADGYSRLLSAQQLTTIRLIINKFKPAKWRCAEVMVVIPGTGIIYDDGFQYDTGLQYDRPETWVIERFKSVLAVINRSIRQAGCVAPSRKPAIRELLLYSPNRNSHPQRSGRGSAHWTLRIGRHIDAAEGAVCLEGRRGERPREGVLRRPARRPGRAPAALSPW